MRIDRQSFLQQTSARREVSLTRKAANRFSEGFAGIRTNATARQDSAIQGNSRQESVTGPSRLNTSRSAATARGETAQPADATSSVHPAVSALKSLLDTMGATFQGVDLKYSEEQVFYPGGSYINKLVTVTRPDGMKEHMDANLVMKSPWVAAGDVAHLLSHKKNA